MAMEKGTSKRDEQIKLDVEVARKTLIDRKVDVDEARLENGVRNDWDVLKHARETLSPEELKHVMKTIVRLIQDRRRAAIHVMPDVLGKVDQHLKAGGKPEDFDMDMMEMMLRVNARVGAEQTEMDPKALGSLAVAKKMISEQLRLMTTTKKALTRVEAAERYAETIALDAETLKVDQELYKIINYVAGGESLEEGIKDVMKFIKSLLEDKGSDITFYLVNEKNHYHETEHLTKIPLHGNPHAMTKAQFEKLHQKPLFHDEEKFTFSDTQENVFHVELKIADRRLGVMEIQLMPGETLDKKLEAFINQARTRLNTKIDEALRGQRMGRIDSLAHEILDRYGACDEYFEKGIAELMKEVCLYSKATEADLLLVVADEDKDECDHFIAKRYSDDRDPESLEETAELREIAYKPAKLMGRSGGKHTMVKDIVDPTAPDQKIIGKIIFRTDEGQELVHEDKTFLRMASMIIASHASQWRNNLRLKIEGHDPKIAEMEMREGIADLVRIKATIVETDISGFTAICDRLERKLFKNDKVGLDALLTIKKLVKEFLTIGHRISSKYCGTWDKGIGDMAVAYFGGPIGKKTGNDPLGYGEDDRHPEFFAINALKASLLIQRELKGLSDNFRTNLIKLAEKKFSPPAAENTENTEDWTKFQENPEQWYLDHLRDEFGLSPVIDTTTVVYTGDVAIVKISLPSSNTYTVLGTTMNTASRLQGKARRKQILIPRYTQQLIKPLIDADTPVPYRFSHKRKTRYEETFSQFLTEKLGLDAASIKSVINEQFDKPFKNLQGSNLYYSFEVRNAAALLPTKSEKLDAEGLAQYDGQEFSIHHAQISDDKIKFSLATIPLDGEKGTTFKATIRQGGVEEVVPVYISRQEYEKRRHRGNHRTLRVQDSRFTEFDYKPLGEMQKTELDHVLDQKNGLVQGGVIQHKNTPSGCYRLVGSKVKGERTTLEMNKGTYIFKVNYQGSRIKSGIEEIVADDETLTFFKAYLIEIIEEIDTDAEANIIFVHKGDYFQLTTLEAASLIEELKTQIHRSVPPREDRDHRYSMMPAPGSPRSMVLTSTATMRAPAGKIDPDEKE